MKNRITIIALAAVISFAITACEVGSGTNEIIVRQTSGSLTITGLGEYNGKYVAALGSDGGKTLLAAQAISGETVSGGLVANGQVTLKVWKNVSDTEWGAFNGNGDLEFTVDVFAVSAVELHEDHYHAYNHADEVASGHVDVTFSNGTGSGAFEEAPHEVTVQETTGSLTITGLGEYNDKHIVALYYADDKKLIAADSIASNGVVTGGTVSGGSVTLKVWKFVSNTEWGAANESGDIEFNYVHILGVPTVYLHNDHYHPYEHDDVEATGHVDVTFDNGTGTGAFEEGDDEHEGHDH